MNGEVDVSGRALIVLSIRRSHGADAVSLQAWVDTAFTGELVIPQATITRLGLPQSAAVMAGLADGTQVVLDTFSCVIDWFGQERVVEVVEDHRSDTYRAAYVAKLRRAVYVLHVFQKKSTRGVATPRRHLELIRQRLEAAKRLDSEEHHETHQ